MPTLPTITVTQAQADRIILAFGTDQTTAIAAYKDWLTREVRAKVLAQAMEAHIATYNAGVKASIEATTAALPPEPVVP